MEPYHENSRLVRPQAGFPRHLKANPAVSGVMNRRPLGEITSNLHRQQPKSAFRIYQDNDENRDPNPVFRKERPVLSVQNSFSPVAPFVIHQDEDVEVDDAEPVFGPSSFPPPPEVPYPSSLQVSQPLEFRQNVSISSVSTDNDDDYEDSDDCPTSGLKGNSETEEEEEEVLVGHDLHLPVPDSVLAVEDYTEEIFTHARKRELECLPKFNYMDKQADITFPMRSILVDWLVEVGEEFECRTETIYLACNYVDRFLSFMSVQRAKLQLVGAASLFIASKYEEIYPRDLTEFVHITDDTYTKKQVLKMEKLILGVLQFSVSVPTAYFFVNHLAKLSGCNDKTTSLARFLAELTLLDGERYLCFLPSIIASSAIALARHTMGFAAWDENMVKRTGYQVTDFQACLVELHGTFSRARRCPQQAIVDKYKHARHLGVSNIAPTPIF